MHDYQYVRFQNKHEKRPVNSLGPITAKCIPTAMNEHSLECIQAEIPKMYLYKAPPLDTIVQQSQNG